MDCQSEIVAQMVRHERKRIALIKACLNGEPTYEGMNAGENGLGWWQGEEAWNQLLHGGTQRSR